MAKVISSLPGSTGTLSRTSQLINDGESGVSTYVELDDISTVATTGDYNNLINVPINFTPKVHTHNISDISGTKSEFNTSLTDGDFLFVGDVLDTPDATVTTKGILKLTGDLGGTADNPTTPTAIHKTGDEVKQGILTLSDGLKIVGNTTSTTATKVNVQENDGTINTISKSDLVNVVEVNDVPSLPLVGEVGKIYVVKNVNKIYRWNGTFYQELAVADISGLQAQIDLKAPISSVHNPVTLGTANGLSLATQQLSLGLASSGTTGALSGTDWDTFNNKVNGIGTNNFLTKWSGTNTVNASGAWRETSNRLANAADNGNSDFQVTGQIDLKSKNTQGDGGQLGAELLTTGIGDASWTGTSFATGYTHSTGSVTTLTSTLSPVVSNLYQVAYTVTGRTAGSFTIIFGGTTTAGITASSAVGHIASTTGTLVITPTSDFNGTIVLSIKQITAGTASFVFRDNGGTIKSELRILGGGNTANGTSALQNNTTGNGNIANGVSALRNNTTGNYNIANGVGALLNNTSGNGNTANGESALRNNTTGNYNTANGANAGRYISNGTSLTVANRSTFLGVDTKALSDNSTNETVVGHNAIGDGNNTVSIGNTSVVSSRLRGRILQGNVVDNLIDSGQFSGNVLATGFKTASGTASQFLKANGSVDATVYAPLASPSLTGTPTAPTATAGENTTQVATTAFVAGGLATKENAFSKNTAFNKNFGTTAGTVVEGNDSRLNNGQTAFSWGNHANAGYALSNGSNLQSYTPSDWVSKSIPQVINASHSFTNGDLELSGHLYRSDSNYGSEHYDHYYGKGTAIAGSANSFANLRVRVTDGGIKTLRFGGDGSFSWDEANVLHALNFNSYSPTLTGTGATGNWGINISGNAGTATTSSNSTLWGGDPFGPSSAGNIVSMMGYNPTSARWEPKAEGAIRTFLGLGSNAYSSTAYLPLSGGTLTGALNGTSSTFSSSVTVGGNISSNGAKGLILTNGSTWEISADLNNLYFNEAGISTRMQIAKTTGAVTIGSSVTATNFNGSATLTGTPTAPTAAPGTNTTQIATTAFVTSADSGNVKLTGDQTISGQKNFSSTGKIGMYTNNAFPAISVTTSGSIGRTAAEFINSSSFPNSSALRVQTHLSGGVGNMGLIVDNYSPIGTGIVSNSSEGGVSISSQSGNGDSYVSNITSGGTGRNYVGRNNGTETYSVDKTGSVTATQYKISALNTAPASATATGTLGEIRITAGFIYVCTATNTWVRTALATW